MSSAAAIQPAPELQFLDAEVSVERRSDGSMILRTEVPFEPTEALVHSYLRQWALARPQQTFLAERSADGSQWHSISYSETYDAAARLASAFVAKGLRPERPILILSGNGITHQLVALAAMMAGIPYTPLSVAYSTMSGDLGKLRAILRILDPGLVFAAGGAPFARALAIEEMRGRDIVVGDRHERSTARSRWIPCSPRRSMMRWCAVPSNCRRKPSQKFSSRRARPVRRRACRRRTG